MIHIFIGYGGGKAEQVANDLDNFLSNEPQINVFLASPRTHHLLSIDEWKTEIDKNLLDCNIALFVCHKGTSRSKPVKREIDFLFDNNMEHKIISFANTETCIPKKIRKRWTPLHFTPEKPEESFCRLLNEVFRCHIKFLESARIVSEEERMV
jgi:hypothetical protein